MSDTGMAQDQALSAALLESRQRWRDLVRISADLAFETDPHGRFVFLAPEDVLGWSASTLIGEPAEALLMPEDGPCFNPFVAWAPFRDCQVWLREPDDTPRRMSFSVAPLYDESGVVCGARGVARDATGTDQAGSSVARALRRAELIDQLRAQLRLEVLAPRMMARVLGTLGALLGAQGTAVLGPDRATGINQVLFSTAPVPEGLGATCLRHLSEGLEAPLLCRENAGTMDATGVMGVTGVTGVTGAMGAMCAVTTQFGPDHALLAWRPPHDRGWSSDEVLLLSAATTVVRTVLDQGAVQRELAHDAATDTLTGLPNRRAFQGELERRMARQEFERSQGALMFIDIDGLKPVNDHSGHEVGDRLLRAAAGLLLGAVRPSDLVARLGGDEFAIWMDATDQFTAAERADNLCRAAAMVLAQAAWGTLPVPDGTRKPGLSIGIAIHEPSSGLDGETLLRLADAAMYIAKQEGGGGWRVWRPGITA
jgi:diguanylate cyclase (GGDEF)-like protein